MTTPVFISHFWQIVREIFCQHNWLDASYDIELEDFNVTYASTNKYCVKCGAFSHVSHKIIKHDERTQLS